MALWDRDRNYSGGERGARPTQGPGRVRQVPDPVPDVTCNSLSSGVAMAAAPATSLSKPRGERPSPHPLTVGPAPQAREFWELWFLPIPVPQTPQGLD